MHFLMATIPLYQQHCKTVAEMLTVQLYVSIFMQHDSTYQAAYQMPKITKIPMQRKIVCVHGSPSNDNGNKLHVLNANY